MSGEASPSAHHKGERLPSAHHKGSAFHPLTLSLSKGSFFLAILRDTTLVSYAVSERATRDSAAAALRAALARWLMSFFSSFVNSAIVRSFPCTRKMGS